MKKERKKRGESRVTVQNSWPATEQRPRRGTVQYQHRNTGGGVAGAAGKVAFKSTREGECRQVEQYLSLFLSLSEKTSENRTRTTTK